MLTSASDDEPTVNMEQTPSPTRPPVDTRKAALRQQCEHFLGTLPCTNDLPHRGRGRGCVHDAGDVPDRHTDDAE